MKAFLNRLNEDSKLQGVLLLVVLVGVGLWLRIRNLGELSLIVDEGVQALAVEAILENNGEMESGVVYLRGPLYLYTQAAVSSLFQLNEFWLRLPSVVFGVAAIIPTYILGKDLFNRPVGILSAAIVALSAWEIEMSRYARVYIAFQFFFLLSLICFYRGFLADQRKFRVGFLVAAFLAFLTHELSQVLVTLFAIPLLMPRSGWRKLLRLGGWAVAVGGLLFIARQFNGIHLPPGSSWASEQEASAGGAISQITSALGIPPLNGPDFDPLFHAVQHDFAAVVAILLVGGIAVGHLGYRLVRGGAPGRLALGASMVCATVFYQFGLVLIILAAYLALYPRSVRIRADRTLLASGVASAICLVGWFIILARSPNLLLVEVPLAMFGFPAFYKYLLRWLVRGWPVMTVLLVGGSVWLFVRYLRDRRHQASLFLLGALYIPALSASLFESSYVPEYTLHLYPLIVLLVAAAVWECSGFIRRSLNLRTSLTRRMVFVLLASVFLLVSHDTNPVFAWQIGERTYQSEKPPVRNVMTFPFYSDYHPDLKGASKYVKENMSDGDKVAVIAPNHKIQISDFYLGGVDFIIMDRQKSQIRGISDNGNHIHYTSGCCFITSIRDIDEKIMNNNQDVWVIGSKRTLDSNNEWISNTRFKDHLKETMGGPDYVARDSITIVKKIN